MQSTRDKTQYVSQSCTVLETNRLGVKGWHVEPFISLPLMYYVRITAVLLSSTLKR